MKGTQALMQAELSGTPGSLPAASTLLPALLPKRTGLRLRFQRTVSSWIALLFIAGFPSLARTENWPCFRGPTRQGISTETGLPLKWTGTENILWRTAIPGESWSSPIVWGDQVFLTTA